MARLNKSQRDPKRAMARLGLIAGAFSVGAFGLLACSDDDDGDNQTATVQASSTLDDIDTLETVQKAEEYALAVFGAWEEGDTATIEDLASDEAAESLSSRAWAEADGWEFENCTVSDETYCTWQGASESLIFELNSSALPDNREALIRVEFGEPAGSGDGAIDVPAGDPEAYADAAYTAWSEADDAALEQLLGGLARPVLDSRPWQPSDGWKKLGCESTSEGYFCRWEATNGDTLEFKLDEGKAEGGEEQAVTDVLFSGI